MISSQEANLPVARLSQAIDKDFVFLLHIIFAATSNNCIPEYTLIKQITIMKKYVECRGRLPILTPLSGYPNKTNSFTGKIISKLGLGVYCIRLQSCQTWTLYIIYIGEEM